MVFCLREVASVCSLLVAFEVKSVNGMWTLFFAKVTMKGWIP